MHIFPIVSRKAEIIDNRFPFLSIHRKLPSPMLIHNGSAVLFVNLQPEPRSVTSAMFHIQVSDLVSEAEKRPFVSPSPSLCSQTHKYTPPLSTVIFHHRSARSNVFCRRVLNVMFDPATPTVAETCSPAATELLQRRQQLHTE